MKVTLAKADAVTAKADVLAVPVFAGPELGPGAEEAVAALGTPVAPLLETRGFTGKAGEAAAFPTLGRLPATVLLLVGVGERDKVDAEVLRRAAAAVVRQSRGARKAVTTLAHALPAYPEAAVQAVTEGALLAAYRFDKYKQAKAGSNGRRPPAELASLAVVPAAASGRGSGGRNALTAALAAGQARAAATNLARDLSNEPANALHPADLATAARKLLDGKGVTVKVKDEKALAREGFGGIIGVGQGAEHPPRLIELRYHPKGATGEVVLVGKGITFDSGGLSLKPADSMKTMKTDMSGAAAVLAAMSALAELDVKVAVTGYLASAENMPSGAATRPGDVLTMKNGKTVEVLNTDAEGRLVMADALALGAAAKPDAIVDVATLTGACVVALGNRYTGLMANDDALAAELLDSAAEAGEPTWRLPLPPEYRKDIESDVADLKNVGDRYGGALFAGLFLEQFVDDRPWVHLDIAGPARAESDDGYLSKGSTGVAVRTLLTWLERRGANGRPTGR
jgi:leucyl aminopeptidase